MGSQSVAILSYIVQLKLNAPHQEIFLKKEDTCFETCAKKPKRQNGQ